VKPEGVIVSVDCPEIAYTLPHNAPLYSRLVLVTAPGDHVAQQAARRSGVELVVSDVCWRNGDAFNKGAMLNAGLAALQPRDWFLFTDADCFLPRAPLARLQPTSLRPDCLYYAIRRHLSPKCYVPDPKRITNDHLRDRAGNEAPWGYFQLFFAPYAAQLCGGTLRLPECFCSAASVDHWFQARWPQKQRVLLNDFVVLHIYHGPTGTRWNNRGSATGWRFVGHTPDPDYKESLRRLPVPCELRRIHITQLDTEALEYYGDALPEWSTDHDCKGLYEFSARPIAVRPDADARGAESAADRAGADSMRSAE